jgi:hypothetical protein
MYKSVKVIEKYLYDGFETTVQYSVNKSGSGLWRNGRQIIGTADFHASSPRELMRKIRRECFYPKTVKTVRMIRGSAVGF